MNSKLSWNMDGMGALTDAVNEAWYKLSRFDVMYEIDNLRRNFPNIEVVQEGDRFYVMGRGYIVDLDGSIAKEFRSHLNF